MPCHVFLSLRSWRLCERYSSSARSDLTPEAFLGFSQRRQDRKEGNTRQGFVLTPLDELFLIPWDQEFQILDAVPGRLLHFIART
jgi:hypothetical protein